MGHLRSIAPGLSSAQTMSLALSSAQTMYFPSRAEQHVWVMALVTR